MSSAEEGPMRAVFEEVYGDPFTNPPKKDRDDLLTELRDRFRHMRNMPPSQDAFRELTEEDVLQTFREVLVEEIMRS